MRRPGRDHGRCSVSSGPGTSTHVLPGDPPVEVVLRRSSRAKRFSLRVSRSDGRVSMSLPLWAPEDEALAFLRDRADWVRGHLDRAPDARASQGSARPSRSAESQADRRQDGRAARFADGRITCPTARGSGPR
jgi:predicted metal-dependent hydrolase